MESQQEFLDNLNQLRTETDNYTIIREDFISDLVSDFMHFTNILMPNVYKNPLAREEIKDEAETLAMIAYEYVERSIDCDDDDALLCSSREIHIPKVLTRKEGEIELKEFLKSIPPILLTEKAVEIYWEDYESYNKIASVKIELHNLVKSVMTKYFEKDIIQFSKAGFYYLENTSWMMVANPFLKKLYKY